MLSPMYRNLRMLQLKQELDWFSFENKVRNLIFEVIDPISKRIEKFDKKINNFKIESETNK